MLKAGRNRNDSPSPISPPEKSGNVSVCRPVNSDWTTLLVSFERQRFHRPGQRSMRPIPGDSGFRVNIQFGPPVVNRLRARQYFHHPIGSPDDEVGRDDFQTGSKLKTRLAAQQWSSLKAHVERGEQEFAEMVLVVEGIERVRLVVAGVFTLYPSAFGLRPEPLLPVRTVLLNRRPGSAQGELQ
jgi:hypothetical protein